MWSLRVHKRSQSASCSNTWDLQSLQRLKNCFAVKVCKFDWSKRLRVEHVFSISKVAELRSFQGLISYVSTSLGARKFPRLGSLQTFQLPEFERFEGFTVTSKLWHYHILKLSNMLESQTVKLCDPFQASKRPSKRIKTSNFSTSTCFQSPQKFNVELVLNSKRSTRLVNKFMHGNQQVQLQTRKLSHDSTLKLCTSNDLARVTHFNTGAQQEAVLAGSAPKLQKNPTLSPT